MKLATAEKESISGFNASKSSNFASKYSSLKFRYTDIKRVVHTLSMSSDHSNNLTI